MIYNAQRKQQLSENRTKITEDEWYDYLEQCYPEWWKSIYGNKWRINIIYYSENDENPDPTVYPLYIHKNSTMQKIITNFDKMLKYQKTAIKMCFGNDISENIIKHLPNNKLDVINNYIYVHKRIFNIDGSVNFTRYRVPNDKTLVRLCGYLCEQDTANINLRIRLNPFNKKGRNFERVYCY